MGRGIAIKELSEINQILASVSFNLLNSHL